MEPALDVINRALHGDHGARSFLERTSSIYVLDATDPSKPKTYGCWNFIHQAMNEVERFEAAYARSGVGDAGLVHHVQLLASMALRVARRRPMTDKALIMTCLANGEHQLEGSASQSQQWLVDLNEELREIVMGRIAAMAFDFSFHRNEGPHGTSAFGNRVVMDTFCAILSANAVSSGPQAIKHFATEWIIPSSKNLPAPALASVIFHLATESTRKSSPAGTKDALQQLSGHVFSAVLIPVLAEAVEENSSSSSPNGSAHAMSSQVAASCIRAIWAWCHATELSLPQIRHICNKSNVISVDIVTIISDTLYSDSPEVIDALADLFEELIVKAHQKPASEVRMNQVRYIIQVDESTFKSQFTPEQLKTIESKEMESILGDLLSAVSLQRFRFSERQKSGDHDVCRNLARIAASACSTCVDDHETSRCVRPDHGVIELLHKAASHPSVGISALALEALIVTASTGCASADGLLPILQQRAIIPHHVAAEKPLSLAAHDLCGVSFQEFRDFREHILVDALRICWNANRGNYMESCTVAIEEFCTARPSLEVSLQLEAALFCIQAIVPDILQSSGTCSEYLKRCSSALGGKPPVVLSNPLTLARVCQLLQKLTSWFVAEEGLDLASDLTMTAFLKRYPVGVERLVATEVIRESGLSLRKEASYALKELCCIAPAYFATDARLTVLLDAWNSSFEAFSNGEDHSLPARSALAAGICAVLATLENQDRQLAFFQAMASRTFESLEDAVQSVESASASVKRLADEIYLVALLPRVFTDAKSPHDDEMESGCDTSPDTRKAVPESVVVVMRKAWAPIMNAAENCCYDEGVAASLCLLLSNLMPKSVGEESALTILDELFTLARTMVKAENADVCCGIFGFLSEFLHTFGGVVEQGAAAAVRGLKVTEREKQLGRLFEDLMMVALSSSRSLLGIAWTSPTEQGQGQPAFESKPKPSLKVENASNGCLLGIFLLLNSCLGICPVALLHLPAGPGVDADDDGLLRRAIDSAVLTLCDCDPAIAASAMRLLKTMTMNTASQDEFLRSFCTESLSRVCRETVRRLLEGSCGRLDRCTLSTAAQLFMALLQKAPRTESEAHVVAALRQDFFQLGDQAKSTCFAVLGRCAQNALGTSDLTTFLEELWDLHQVEDADALPSSELVAQFLLKYA